ncbi:MAG: acetyl-CoA carboxylase biotin carboxyl carrier protein subunit [Bdellovibrionales bacterium]|nr:acetyl-CoA carboxylase biotin carboxyl carrier protein subunit [Oligoflexia bacterium]
MIEGKVGSKKLSWQTTPKGRSGEGVVTLANGKAENVRWIKDDQGIWIETSEGYFGFDVRKSENDDGLAQYELLKRKHADVSTGVSFFKAGEGEASGAQKAKKSIKVKSQMPGKIVRIMVKAGDEVKKGQALIVMEAMKMENEIKALQDGIIKELKVTEGQAVETGAELLHFE